jgi:hypothetical protein
MLSLNVPKNLPNLCTKILPHGHKTKDGPKFPNP